MWPVDDVAGFDSTMGFTQQANNPASSDADVRAPLHSAINVS